LAEVAQGAIWRGFVLAVLSPIGAVLTELFLPEL
jgi:hypothetical protein